MRRAWVSEDIEEDDRVGRTDIATGRFSARIEDATLPEGLELAPRGLRLADALKWARARADVVILEIHDADGVHLYSAGVKRATRFRPRLLEMGRPQASAAPPTDSLLISPGWRFPPGAGVVVDKPAVPVGSADWCDEAEAVARAAGCSVLAEVEL